MKVLFLMLVQVAFVKAAAILGNAVEEEGSDDKRKCPPWDKWESSKCLWPSQAFSSLPKACTALPKIPDIPDVLKQFAESKQREIYSFVQNIFKLRGAKSACGYCSRKIRCRQREGGQWKRGCRFLQAQMVDEECEGSNACVIKPILGACPPPIPMPHRRRRRNMEEGQPMKMQAMDSNGLGDQNLEIDSGKNTTQGPPLWHCARNKDGSKCLCCCGWYFPDAKSGKCVSIRKDDFDNDQLDDQTWNWSGLMDLDLQSPFFLDGAMIDESLIEQIEPPPMDNPAEEGNRDAEPREVIDQMAAPEGDPIVIFTGHQVAAPVTDTVEKKMLKKLGREDNEM